MRQLILFLLISSTIPLGLSQQNSPQAQPLSDAEKRLVIFQLYELKSCRSDVLSYEEYIKREKELDEKERDISVRAVELEKQATAIAIRERDLQAEKAMFYEQAYKAVKKKNGIRCILKKVFTLGVGKCS